MRDALKNLFSNSIVLEDNSQFYYSIKPHELTNAVGQVVAVLQEYIFTKKDEHTGDFSCKLYKTKEGNWYDINTDYAGVEKNLTLRLKTALNKQESPAMF